MLKSIVMTVAQLVKITEKHRVSQQLQTTPCPCVLHSRLSQSVARLPPRTAPESPGKRETAGPHSSGPSSLSSTLARGGSGLARRPRPLALTVHADVMVREDDRPGALGGPAQRDVNGAMQSLDVLLLRRESRRRGLSWGRRGLRLQEAPRTLLMWS